MDEKSAKPFSSLADEVFDLEDTVQLQDGDGGVIDGQIVSLPNAIDGVFVVQTSDGRALQMTADDMNHKIIRHNGVKVKRTSQLSPPPSNQDGNNGRKSFFEKWGCSIILLMLFALFATPFFYKLHESYKLSEIRKKEIEEAVLKAKNDSIRKAFVADSLLHDPHYQDSLCMEESNFDTMFDSIQKVVEKKLAGIMLVGDSVYHTCFHELLLSDDIKRIRFVTNKDIESNGYEWCDECRNLDFMRLLEDGEIIYKENADEYCSHSNDY